MRLLVPLVVLFVTTTVLNTLSNEGGVASGWQQTTVAEDAKTTYPRKSAMHADTEAAFESSGLLNRLEPFEF